MHPLSNSADSERSPENTLGNRQANNIGDKENSLENGQANNIDDNMIISPGNGQANNIDDRTTSPENGPPDNCDDKEISHANGTSNGHTKVEKACEDFDDILEIIGTEGKYQNILLYTVLCPIVTVAPFLFLNTVFMWDTPDHFCNVPGRAADMKLEQWKNLTLPWEQAADGRMRHSQCKMIDQVTGNETSCQFGWEYDKTDYETTIPSEFNWVCDKDHYATDCFTWDNIGSAIGNVLFGIMADKYGRKPVFFLACATNLLFKTASLFFAHNIWLYKILQLLGGFAFPALFTIPAQISAEVSSITYRSWTYSVTWMIWVLGNSILPFVAMITRGWFLFGCVAAVPGLFLFLYYPFVQESPRWLITTGKAERAIQICLKIAKTNEKNVDPVEIDRKVKELVCKIEKDEEGQNVGVWTLFSKLRIAKHTIMLTIAITMNTLLYYGITLNTTRMAGNKFLNYFILAIVELPAGWLAGKLVEKTGRRWTQTAFFGLCTVSCLISAVATVFPGQSAVVIIGALGIKFGVTVTSLVAYLQGTEIFPTQLRSTGNGIASTVANTASIFGPYIVYTGNIYLSFPYVILCLCSFFGLLSAALLPETFKQRLPETIEDANKFGKGHKFWSYLPQAQEKTEKSLS